jgi:hypothetical protein
MKAKQKQNFDELEANVSVFQADRSSLVSECAEILATCADLPDSGVVTGRGLLVPLHDRALTHNRQKRENAERCPIENSFSRSFTRIISIDRRHQHNREEP